MTHITTIPTSELKKHTSELSAKDTEIARLKALLKSIEFSCEIRIFHDSVFHCCPKCGGILEEFVRQKHKDDCELYAALQEPQ